MDREIVIKRTINKWIIHCSATPNGKLIPIKEIDNWHKARGFCRRKDWREAWQPDLRSVGYHFVINPGGVVSHGRHIGEYGAHCAGENTDSLGVCLIGTDRFTIAQWVELEKLIVKKQVDVYGHNEFSTKACPCFDVQKWLIGGMIPLERHILTEEDS